MNECNTKIPNRLKNKTCVKEGAGGKEGVMINVYDSRSRAVLCGKKLDEQEHYFYETVKSLKKIKPFDTLYKYTPKYYYLCEHSGKSYVVLENLFNLKRKGSKRSKGPKFLDIKIGFQTAMKKTSGKLKIARHKILDKYFTVSGREGFRIEGTNIQLNPKLRTQSYVVPSRRRSRKYKIQATDPRILFSEYFVQTKQKPDKIIKQLQEFYEKFCIPNLRNIKKLMMGNQSNLIALGLVGSSILIIENTVRLIDFSHPIFVDHESTTEDKKIAYKMILNFNQGLSSLIDLLIDLF